MKLFVHNENIVDRVRRYDKIRKFAGVRYFDRSYRSSFNDSYDYFIGSYDECKHVHPDYYLLISEERYSTDYNMGYVIGSDCFRVVESEYGVDLIFDDDNFQILEYTDDFSRTDNYKLIDCSSNFLLFEYLEVANTDIVRYDYSRFDSRLINKKNIVQAINGHRSDIKFLLAPESSVVDRDGLKIFRFDTYNPKFGTKDVFSENKTTYPVYISVASDNRYCFKLSSDVFEHPDSIMYMGDFYALALPFDKSVMDKRMHTSRHKELSDESCFNIDTFVYNDGQLSDNGAASSSDYSFAELVDAIDAGAIYNAYFEKDPDLFAKNIDIYFDKKNSAEKRLLQYQIIQSQLDVLSNSYKDVSLHKQFVKTFSIIGGYKGLQSTGTMLLIPDMNGQCQVCSQEGLLNDGHTFWNGRAAAICFNNDQVPANIRAFHFGDDDKLHFSSNYVLSGFYPDNNVSMDEAKEAIGLIDIMEEHRKDIVLSGFDFVSSPRELVKREIVNNDGIEDDYELEGGQRDYDKSL